MTRYQRWLCLLVAALPAVGPVLLIHRYGVDFHYGDEWDPGWTGLIVGIHNYGFSWTNLFVQNNVHRQVVPRLLLLLTNPLTHWNNIAVLYMGWVWACVISLTVLAMIRRTVGRDGKFIAIWFLCNLLIFSPGQFEAWLWGIAIDQWMLTAFLFLSFSVATSSLAARIKVPLCLLLATAATYCFGNGVLAWPLTGLLLLWPTAGVTPGNRKGAAAVWGAGCLLCLGFYFFHFTRVTEHRPSAAISDILLYNLMFMSGAFANATTYPLIPANAVIGAVMFAMLLAAAGYCVWAWKSGRRQLCDRMLVWFMVAGYAVLSGLFASLMRSGYGAQEALTSRYTEFAVYLPVALVNLAAIIAADRRSLRPTRPNNPWIQFSAGSVAALILIHVLSLPHALHGAWEMCFTCRQGKAALLLANVLPDNPAISPLVSADNDVIPNANVLDDMGYLRPPLIRTSDARQFIAADAGENAPVVGLLEACAGDAMGQVNVTGWAINRRDLEMTDGVFLTYEDQVGRQILFVAAQMNLKREDVLQREGSPIYEWSGWKASFPPTRLPANPRTVRIKAWALDADTGKAYPLSGSCEIGR